MFEQHTGFVEAQMAQLVAEGEELVNLKCALQLAFRERCNREFDDGTDSFNAEDERRGDELLAAMLPGGA